MSLLESRYVDGLGWKPVFENKEIIFFQTGGMIFALFLCNELAKDFAADAATYGRPAMALAHNVRTKAEVDPLMKRGRCGCDDSQARAQSIVGRLLRILRGSRWFRLGDSLESGMADR